MSAQGRVAVVAAMALVATAAPFAGLSTAAAAQSRTASEITALQDIKQHLTAVEQKQSVSLVVEKRLRADGGLRTTLPRFKTNLATERPGTVTVDIQADVTPSLLAAVRDAGGTVKYSSLPHKTIHADLPLAAIDGIAARADVRMVKAAPPMDTNNAPAPADPPASLFEGDKAHGADTARANYGVTGSGNKVCVLSDGVDSLAATQAAGQLPDVDVLAGQQGQGDEGTAMLEIVHSMAPGAALGFATAANGEAGFADNIRALRTQQHCDIIVDDVYYLDESPFQDGPVAQAVLDVTKDGALYFSSAGNSGNKADGTSGHWEGDFADSGRKLAGTFGTAHDFAPGAAVQTLDPVSKGSLGDTATLFWSDPLGGAKNDFDLYVIDPAGNVVSAGLDKQDGTQDPVEGTQIPPVDDAQYAHNAPYFLAVVRYGGKDKRYLSVNVNRGRFVDSDNLKGYSTAGVTAGHSAVPAAFSVAAAPAATALPDPLEPGDPANPAGPYPGVFTAQSRWERFTSDGGRRVFYNPDGTPVTPGNVTSTGGVVRPKPDIAAADGVNTTVPGFQPFYGTSAAAPHAAAIAALLRSAKPTATAAQIRQALTGAAIDIGPAGHDNVTGFGIVMPGPALQALTGR
ncbi:S8 family serine peptidase [Kutzneria sp. NPDC052558]|uniref:S8 family serine peptidase n=1 Tax=Kutzneria sp. NPDC052558 TaxID=3364121 RepID=UPI0037C7C893